MTTPNTSHNYRAIKVIKHLLRILLLAGFVLGIGIWATGAVLKSNLRKQNPAPGPMILVDGHRMHINCTGEGSPAVILEAGLDDFSIFWSHVQPDVAKMTRVCSYDRAGLGWSEAVLTPHTGGTMVRELHSLLVNSNVEGPYIMVGHSFGGALVQLYAHLFPQDVAGVVLVDAAPDDLFVRVPFWRDAIAQKVRLYRALVPRSSFGLLVFTPGNIPNRGMTEDVLVQYRALAVSTEYFRMGVEENKMFENNLAELRASNISLGSRPLIVISRGYWDPMPGFSDLDNQLAWQRWQEMQVDLLILSSNSRQIIAIESEHPIQLQQPELVTEAILELVEANRK